MNTKRAVDAFEASLTAESATPDYGAKNRETFLDEQRTKLRALTIPPIVVTARPSEWAKTYGGFEDTNYEMIALAGEKNHWLLYDPSNGMFSQATGTLGNDLELIGFRSKDALAEWFG